MWHVSRRSLQEASKNRQVLVGGRGQKSVDVSRESGLAFSDESVICPGRRHEGGGENAFGGKCVRIL